MPSPDRAPRRSGVAAVVMTVLAGLLSAGCGGDGPSAPTAGFGEFSGRWDGEVWRGRGYAVLQADTLYLVGHRADPRYFYDELVRVRVAFRGTGTYGIPTALATLAQVTGGDAGHFPAASGALQVTHYDAAGSRVRGTVHLTTAERGLTWRFESGTFDVPVYASWVDVPRDPGR